MFHAGNQILLTQLMNMNNAPAFYTNCTELSPLIEAASTLLVAWSPLDWYTDFNCNVSYVWLGANAVPVYKNAVSPGATTAKAARRQMELENTPRRAKQFNKMKRGRPVDKYKDDDQTRYQPYIKRPYNPVQKPYTTVVEWESLSKEILQKFHDSKQAQDVLDKKLRLRYELHSILREHYNGCGLYIVGSSMNGFGSNNSDVDMCLMVSDNEINQKTDALGILRNVHKLFNRCNYLHKIELIKAKVPILKFVDRVSGSEVDLNINNSVGLRNTRLLRCYSRIDRRVKPLVLVIKMWARYQGINDAKTMTISSYSLTLMVIHFLQYGVSPPVLPCLQKLFPKKFDNYSDVRFLEDETLPAFSSSNHMSLGELLVMFLDYFTNRFDFNSNAMSVRTGEILPKFIAQTQLSPKNSPGQWKCLSIEEPFDCTNTARSVYNEDVFTRIKQVFQTSLNRIQDTKELGSILHS